MSRYTKGWVKLHRSAVESDLHQNVYLWGLWTYLINIANWQESKIIWKGKQRVLPPGSVVFGIQQLAEQWDCSHTTIRKWLHYLQDSERIAIESSTRGSIITICNWEVYQAHDDEVLKPSVYQVSTKCLPSVRQVPLNEEDKNIRKKKEEESVSTERLLRNPVGAVEELSNHELLREHLGQVSQQAQRAWLATYSDTTWVTQELLKAISWLAANPQRRPKTNYSRFFGGWLSRGWENHRKTLPSNKPYIGIAEILRLDEERRRELESV